MWQPKLKFHWPSPEFCLVWLREAPQPSGFAIISLKAMSHSKILWAMNQTGLSLSNTWWASLFFLASCAQFSVHPRAQQISHVSKATPFFNDHKVHRMVSMVKSHMLELSKDKFGCRVIQKCGTQKGWKPPSSEMNKEMESLLGELGRRQSCCFSDTLWAVFLWEIEDNNAFSTYDVQVSHLLAKCLNFTIICRCKGRSIEVWHIQGCNQVQVGINILNAHTESPKPIFPKVD